eukprot:CAMPEP_0174911692 /NCGR_PEP_ID=MMETSP0167-20121228/77758_1 /TAXON_ID=38298 /ORGANISM="Rhodella maculata, Strain CCMP736" /LENGTH=225 /DNA_ID=CAMNT_0016156247 /DNA_START=130 /DNA_END=807 /DNA_ORIENTATION=+
MAHAELAALSTAPPTGSPTVFFGAQSIDSSLNLRAAPTEALSTAPPAASGIASSPTLPATQSPAATESEGVITHREDVLPTLSTDVAAFLPTLSTNVAAVLPTLSANVAAVLSAACIPATGKSTGTVRITDPRASHEVAAPPKSTESGSWDKPASDSNTGAPPRPIATSVSFPAGTSRMKRKRSGLDLASDATAGDSGFKQRVKERDEENFKQQKYRTMFGALRT